MRRGVQGFFYREDELSLFLKGIKTLFSGEIWLSRDILVNLVLNSNITKMPSGQEKAGLTAREMEILALVSMGAKNFEIAEKLYISPHTVKTHLYNLFKKINVDNRFQAALWATQNL
jgi:LuxR family transcriptional regulator of csgAB operon